MTKPAKTHKTKISREETTHTSLRQLKTPVDDVILDKKTPLERLRLAAAYSLRGAEASARHRQEAIAILKDHKAEQKAALMKDIAAGKAYVVELSGKYEREVVENDRLKKRSERMGKDIDDLRDEIDKLKEEQLMSKSEADKLIKEAKAEYERQLNEEVGIWYNKGVNEVYESCQLDHNLLVDPYTDPKSPGLNYERVGLENIHAKSSVMSTSLESSPPDAPAA